MKTEKQKMLSGEMYSSITEELSNERKAAQILIKNYNATFASEKEQRKYILKKLLNNPGNNLIIEPPFYCDYGFNISIKDNVFINYNCVFLDCHKISIGENTLIGPAVQIYTGHHPVDPDLRKNGLEMASPVIIENNVWIGGGAIILPGIRIGKNSTIGAGSVVTKNIPKDSIAFGNPCKVIKKIYQGMK